MMMIMMMMMMMMLSAQLIHVATSVLFFACWVFSSLLKAITEDAKVLNVPSAFVLRNF
jgi:hypothetical protein